MNILKTAALILIGISTVSCVSTKNTIQNIDDEAPLPQLQNRMQFILYAESIDKKYGYDPDFPINVFYLDAANDRLNPTRFLNALAGPNGEAITFKMVDTCCPFPTKKSNLGAGVLYMYEITWPGNKRPLKLYFNIFERGRLEVPVGLTQKKPVKS